MILLSSVQIHITELPSNITELRTNISELCIYVPELDRDFVELLAYITEPVQILLSSQISMNSLWIFRVSYRY